MSPESSQEDRSRRSQVDVANLAGDRLASGLIWVGPVYHRGGYGTVSRSFLTGLVRLGVAVRVISYQERHYADIPESAATLMQRLEVGDPGPQPALVVHSTPDYFPMVKARGVTKTIGCTIFETHGIPPLWVRRCNSIDEIWVPSKFNRRSFASAGVQSNKIFVIPYGIEAEQAGNSIRPTDQTRPFVFLYVFEFGWRKGFDLLLSAFLNEFRRGEAILMLKVMPQHGQTPEAVKREVLGSVLSQPSTTSNQPEVVVLTEPVAASELVRMYSNCDLYISTDRANGWGMPCMEAMALGKPAATINWGGSTEFMNSGNSLLIEPTGRLIPVDRRLRREFPELYGDQCWAEVSEDEVRRVMRWAVGHPKELAEIAARGQRSIREHRSLEAAAAAIVERLDLGYRLEDAGLSGKPASRVQVNVASQTRQSVSRRLRRIWALGIQLPASRLKRRWRPECREGR